MKSAVYFRAVVLFAGGAIITGCMNSKEKKVEQAHEKVVEEKRELQVAEANYTVTVEEFKTEANQRIIDNERRISQLKVELNARLDKLEVRNKELKKKLIEYEDKSEADWESFKRGIDFELDELGQSLKDLAGDNEK